MRVAVCVVCVSCVVCVCVLLELFDVGDALGSSLANNPLMLLLFGRGNHQSVVRMTDVESVQ
jgi:hypothetical protein